ncbi:GAF domain-containing protein [bacterium]|nr:GAF domain-containing protein [bacterium]
MQSPLFIFYDVTPAQTFEIASHWICLPVTSPDQLFTAVSRAEQENRPIIIFISRQEIQRVAKLMEARKAQGNFPPLGWVMVCEEQWAFSEQVHLPNALLDVVHLSGLSGKQDFLLTKLSHLVREFNTNELSRIGAETLQKLNDTFLRLTAERDPHKLLITILSKATELLEAQGGSLFVVDEVEGELTFTLRVEDRGDNKIVLDSLGSMVLENSICGYVALTGKTVNCNDVESSRGNQPPYFNKQLDHQQLPKTVSLITIPLRDSRGDCRAILQLTNKTVRGQIQGFDLDDESILRSFGTQAAICLESSDVYNEVQKLFEGFVRASITAIESRDPSTGGHSERVASMCVALARATTEVTTGIYRSVKFREEEIKELEYAALLHDFGKIGIREEVLVKSKKLYSHQLEVIQERLKTCKASAKIQYLEKLLAFGENKKEESLREYQHKVDLLDSYWKIILSANEPAILHKENEHLLDRIREEKILLSDGQEISLLNQEEYLALSVTQGSLTELERLEIESHVRHTYQFLKMIPWTRDFKGLAEIAYCHHEKLDGTGYPRGLISHEIPLQSKIMTIADIYDALTAADRWYKEAVPVESALQILAHEVKEGKIDPVLFEIFKEKKVYSAAVLNALGKKVA